MTAANPPSGILNKSEKSILDICWAHGASPNKYTFEKTLCYEVGGQVRLVQGQTVKHNHKMNI